MPIQISGDLNVLLTLWELSAIDAIRAIVQHEMRPLASSEW